MVIGHAGERLRAYNCTVTLIQAWQYNTIQIYIVSEVSCESDALLGSELCYVL